MTFKREISIDGVAVIVAAITLITFIVGISNTQKFQGEKIEDHAAQLRKMNETQSSLAETVQVLSAIVNERTGRPATSALQTPRMKDN